MDKYIALIYDDEIWQHFSASEQEQWIGKYSAWVKSLGEDVVSAAPMGPECRMLTSTEVRVIDRSGDPLSATGYFVFQADSWELAIAWARQCPGLEYGGRLEVRKIGH